MGTAMDSSGGVFLEMLTTASQCSAQDFQRSALEIVRGVCDFDMAMWGVVKFGHNERTIYHCINLHGVPTEVYREFGPVAQTDGVGDQVIARPNVDVAALNLHQQLTDPRYVDFMAYARRFEFSNLLYATRPHARPGLLNFIALFRRSVRAEYTNDDVGRSRELLRCAVLSGVINENLSFKSVTTIREGSGFVRARASASGVVLAFDAEFNELMRQQWPHYFGPVLPGELLRALRDSRHHKFLGKHLIAASLMVGDTLFIVACPNERRVELTPRQFEVASLVAGGCSNKEVACRLSSSEKTIANHLSAIYENLGLHAPSGQDRMVEDTRENWKRAALIRWWMEHPRGAEDRTWAGTATASPSLDSFRALKPPAQLMDTPPVRAANSSAPAAPAG